MTIQCPLTEGETETRELQKAKEKLGKFSLKFSSAQRSRFEHTIDSTNTEEKDCIMEWREENSSRDTGNESFRRSNIFSSHEKREKCRIVWKIHLFLKSDRVG